MELSECRAAGNSRSLPKYFPLNLQKGAQLLGFAVALPCIRLPTLVANCPNEDDALRPSTSTRDVQTLLKERGSVEVSLPGLLLCRQSATSVSAPRFHRCQSIGRFLFRRRRSEREIDGRGTWKSICFIRTNVDSSISGEGARARARLRNSWHCWRLTRYLYV